MSHARLTNYLRSKIRNRAAAARFDPLAEALNREESEMGLALYRRAVGPKVLAQLEALDVKWRRRSHNICFNLCGLKATFYLKEVVDEPAGCGGGRSPMHSFDEEAARDAFVDLDNRKKGLKEDRTQVETQLDSFLLRFSTFKQLHEAWPEGRSYFSDLMSMPVANLPALQSVEINSLLGLASAA